MHFGSSSDLECSRMQSARGLFSDIFCMAILKFNNIGTIRGWQTSLRTGDLPDKDALLQEQRLGF